MNDGVAEIKPLPWDALPDIDLYMDQVLRYMPRQGVEIDPTDTLTASMVSNYVKSGTMPGANGKRYGREHLAYLTAIQTLKQVLSVNDTKRLISYNVEASDIKNFYGEYLGILEKTLGEIDFAKVAESDVNANEIGRIALKYAIISYANKLVCERLLYLAGIELDEKNNEEIAVKEKKSAKAEKVKEPKTQKEKSTKAQKKNKKAEETSESDVD